MSNSSLVNCTVKSPNHSGKRTHSIDRISPHCVVGQLTAEGIGGCFTKSSVQASCNYGIGKDGRVVLVVDECNRSWCTSSNSNDQRAVTIECASGTAHPYAMTNAVYDKLVALCTDICKRNGKNKLIWFGDANKSLNYAPKSNEMVITVHRWFKNKACPGDWLYSRLGSVAAEVTKRLGGATPAPTSQPKPQPTPTAKANGYNGTSIVEYLKSIGQDSSFNHRKQLAAKYGIANYTGTASQNITLLNKIRGGAKATSTTAYYKAFNNGSIVAGLKSIGVDSSFNFRSKIAKANGITNYSGTAAQNTKMCNLARQGKLKKA